MRLSHVFALARMFLVYFFRRVLSYGPLRNPAALFGLIALAAATGVGMFLVAYQFLDSLIGPESLELLARLSTVSTIFWTLIAFLFIKILFMKADRLLQFTLQLPASHRERTAALMIYEAVMVLSVIGVLFLPFSSALVALLGLGSIPHIATGLAIPAVLTYLLASTSFNVIMSALLRIGLGRQAHLITAVMMALSIFIYNANFTTLVRDISEDYLGNRVSNHYVDVFVYVSARWGQPVMWLAFLGVGGLLLALVVASSPHRYPEVHKFTRTPIPGFVSPVWPYLAALTRRWENWVTVAVAYVCAGMLFVRGDGGTFLYALGLLVTQGIYAYSATEALRRLPGFGRRAGSEVTMLLSAQAIQLAVAALPILALVAARPETLADAGKVLAACVSAIILTTLVGILFPHDRDNPFSAFVSYAVCVLLIVSLGIMVTVLQLPAPALWAAVVIVHVLAVFYSVLGIRSLQRKARHASAAVRPA
ncbi:hypothetical protein Aph02nite_09880 [Actinoplanes philippinensis]|uniref:ABC-2 type transport system permease protein n=1 Tax=Actinoplanes philippinensis TaxID=35752 RepID=A0A1I2A7M8_9ACTN|nr:hypothetical protein [Actinoplanes philippinensis]GIE75038.1 hypothetical protein Aph02nite_09880 [Actinoplanes philippinensis]SFE39836.1 hypothetical protein SAMN05421541_101554 [Actinoplanes philippinensis]